MLLGGAKDGQERDIAHARKILEREAFPRTGEGERRSYSPACRKAQRADR